VVIWKICCGSEYVVSICRLKWPSGQRFQRVRELHHFFLRTSSSCMDFAVNGDHRVAETVDLGLVFALGRLDHQRAWHGPFPSLAGAGEGGRRPGGVCREKLTIARASARESRNLHGEGELKLGGNELAMILQSRVVLEVAEGSLDSEQTFQLSD
jgi:hypothetical protein